MPSTAGNEAVNITSLRVLNLRCFEDAQFCPGPGLNWLVGGNGAGKTSLLESAFMLSHGRSFRTGGRASLCRQGGDEFLVYAEVARAGQSDHRLGLGRREERWQARVDGVDLTSLAPLFELCPVVCFGPESGSLMLGPAEERRRFLDWCVFHVEHTSLALWRRWRRAVRQRNALLRSDAQDSEFEPWEHDLADLAHQIDAMRRGCLVGLEPYFAEEADRLVPELGKVCVEYRPGWDTATELLHQFATLRAREREQGFTQRGVHRADWFLRFEGIARRDHLSRGQAKAIALVCVLAQTRWLRDRIGEFPLLCLDDLNSELDAEHVAKVLEWVGGVPIQAWLTSTSVPAPTNADPGVRVFHVKHAGITSA